MKCDVFDTYVTKPDGQLMHFDVIVPAGTAKDVVLGYGQSYLASVEVDTSLISAERCRFCHVESATAEMAKAILQQGYFILAMEGCPPVDSDNNVEVFDA